VFEDERKSTPGVLTVVRENRHVALPLQRYDVKARVADLVADVTVTQTYENPFTEPLEAIYIFPLRGGCAVRDFELRIGDRVVRGDVKERGEARREYDEAIEEGRRAALLEQERDDVFTLNVGNIPPGETVDVRMTYSERLPFHEDGRAEMRVPMVIGPRYIPGAPLHGDSVGDGVEVGTDVVPDASRITPPRLADGFDPEIGLDIEIEIGSADDIACSQHAMRLSNGRVSLARKNELLNRDFVLRWRVAGEKLETRVLARDGHGMLTILPPKRGDFLGVPRDITFLIDRSSSMSGEKLASAARACALLLRTLEPRDRFTILAFDNSVEWFSDGLTAADEDGIKRGTRYLRGIEAGGGTELDGALAEALRLAPEPGRAPVLVLITDGQVGDEHRILKHAQRDLGDTRVFTIGVDTAVNEGFLRRLAAAGGGTSAFVVPGGDLDEALRAIGREIGTPIVTGLRIEGADGVTPSPVPDLFSNRPVTVFLRTRGEPIRVRGTFADGTAFDESAATRETDLEAIPHLWARSLVTDLEDRFRLGDTEVRDEIVALAVKHRLLTPFTAYVAVDESGVVNPEGHPYRFVQPVEMPDAWAPHSTVSFMPKRQVPKAYVQRSLPPDYSAAYIAPDFELLEGEDAEAGWPDRNGAVPPTARRTFLPRPGRGSAGPGARPPKARRVAAQERKRIEAAIEALANVLAKLDATADEVDRARRALLDELAASELGLWRPALQRVLRTEAVALIAGLRAGGDASDLRARCVKALEEARVEKEEDFWINTV
jgi:Ca-activated chloride channel family protein